ncbi:MAG: hypothetical protein FWG20_00515 [Candidatus Cloacimonetes bacterium]|nr:hypothetical protein [Candidatus Cloacimonadota bacterium]
MIFGPKEIHKCPDCGIYYFRETLVSGNTIGARYYTDGMRVAPMLPDFPQITKCKKCSTIFWLTQPFENSEEDDLNDALQVQFLNPYEYQEALNFVAYRDQTEERYLRMKLWYCFNDRVRDMSTENDEDLLTKKIFSKDVDQTLYENNCRRLIELMMSTTDHRLIAIAELKRNLQMYDESSKILNTVTDQKYIYAAQCIKGLCDIGFRFTQIIDTQDD